MLTSLLVLVPQDVHYFVLLFLYYVIGLKLLIMLFSDQIRHIYMDIVNHNYVLCLTVYDSLSMRHICVIFCIVFYQGVYNSWKS